MGNESAIQAIEAIWAAIDPRRKTPELKSAFDTAYCFIRDAGSKKAADDPKPVPKAKKKVVKKNS